METEIDQFAKIVVKYDLNGYNKSRTAIEHCPPNAIYIVKEVDSKDYFLKLTDAANRPDVTIVALEEWALIGEISEDRHIVFDHFVMSMVCNEFSRLNFALDENSKHLDHLSHRNNRFIQENEELRKEVRSLRYERDDLDKRVVELEHVNAVQAHLTEAAATHAEHIEKRVAGLEEIIVSQTATIEYLNVVVEKFDALKKLLRD